MTCQNCKIRRRNFFISRGFQHAVDKGLIFHVIVSWINFKETDDRWLKLIINSRTLSKTLSGAKMGAYIRVISLGKRSSTPHAHYLVNKETANLIQRVAHKKWSQDKVRVHIRQIIKIHPLLGYLYDNNFIPSQNDPERIKGIRLLSASRPMKVGFPTLKQEHLLFNQDIKSTTLKALDLGLC